MPYHPVDVHVGQRIRAQRLLLGISQEKLGEATDLTFQQIQKYEKGSNRVGASRLHQFAEILRVPHQFFFEGLPLNARQMETESSLMRAELAMAFTSSNLGMRLAAGFAQLPDPQRRAFVKLVEAAVEDQLKKPKTVHELQEQKKRRARNK
jgi:transcriptional regulator with XRE-family HTH domain